MSENKSTIDFSNYRVHYHPNTEELHADEIRVIALGTGSPTVRPSQVSACWLIEIPSKVNPGGEPERFLFDFGTGSMVNYGALQIPFENTRKAFISHLHSDHWGDFWSYWIGGLAQGRKSEIEVWGPDGETYDLGTFAAVDHAIDAMAWDVASRENNVPERGTTNDGNGQNTTSGPADVETRYRTFNNDGLNVTTHQFQCRHLVTVYTDTDNDIVIKSWPADHALIGAVSFSLEWKDSNGNDIKIVYSGDTKPLSDDPEGDPNDWRNSLEQYKSQFHNANLLIHECFNATGGHYDTEGATLSEETTPFNFHTTPEEFGELMAEYDPYHAVAYHFANDFDTGLDIYNRIRKSYDGRLTLAKDLLAWNVTKDQVITRNVAYHKDTWSDDKFSHPDS